jgi:hypothetical protein
MVDGRPVVIRSRIGDPAVREFAETNFMARARCVLPRDQVDPDGMPISSASMDEWEGKLLVEIDRINAETYPIAVVTGGGGRDLFFTAADGDGLVAAINNVEGDFTFELQLSQVDGPREPLLNSLTPPQ